MLRTGRWAARGGRIWWNVVLGGIVVCGWSAPGCVPGAPGTVDDTNVASETSGALSASAWDEDRSVGHDRDEEKRDRDGDHDSRPPAGCDVELAPTVGSPVPPALRGPGPFQLCGAFGTGATTLIDTSRDGRRLVALTDSGQAWVLDARTFALLGVFAHGAAVSFAGLSPDGDLLATVDDPGGRVALWDVDSHRLIRVITRAAGVPSYFGLGEASFSHDGLLLAVVSATHVDVYSVRTGEALPISARTDLGGGMRVAFAAGDTRLVVARFNYFGNGPFAGFGSIALVDATTGDNLVAISLPTSSLVTFAVSGDGNTVAVGGFDAGMFTIRLINPVTGGQLSELPILSSPLALNHDASRIAVADPPPQPAPPTISVRRTSDSSVIESVQLPAAPPARTRVFAVPGDLQNVLAGDVAPQVVVKVSFASGKTQRVACGAGHFTPIAALGVTRDGRKLVSTGQTVDGDTTFVWNAHTGTLLNIPPPTNLEVPSATSPDGTLMATLAGSGPNFNLVDIATGNVVETLGPAPTRPVSFDFAPSGALIASDSQRDPVDRQAHPEASLWNVAGDALVQRLPHITSVPFSTAEPVLFAPGGRHLFVGGYGTTALWCR